jgi:2-hydroxy-3-keto-5-methylthiopentenyl-1-phosphate phosphatase
MLIICDFDGTVTARDTNSAIARRFAPEAYANVEGRLGSRELTLREVLATEFAAIHAELDVVVEAALEIPFRAGFEQLLDGAAGSGARVLLLSSGFHELIEPMLERDGLRERVPLVANRIEFGADGGQITWRDLPTCELCGEPCKRHDVAKLRAEHAADGAPVVFVGDGFSDRCGAETADRIFARDNLATYLDAQGVAYEPWDDFHEIAAALGLATTVDEGAR